MRNGVAQQNVTIISGTLLLLLLQLGRQQKSTTLAITLVSIKTKQHVPAFAWNCHTYSRLQAKTPTPTLHVQHCHRGVQWRSFNPSQTIGLSSSRVQAAKDHKCFELNHKTNYLERTGVTTYGSVDCQSWNLKQ